ncbi:MAG: hypothetical protein ACE5IQ_01140 [Candidatus Methylomirabilales bacterium]
MEIVALIIAIVALVIAILAYMQAGGIQDLRGQVKSVGSATEALRLKTADALDRLERAVRGPKQSPPPPIPEEKEKEQKGRPADRPGPGRGR